MRTSKPKCAFVSSGDTRSFEDIGLYLRQRALLVAFDRTFVRPEEAESGVLVNVVENEALVALAAQEISKRY